MNGRVMMKASGIIATIVALIHFYDINAKQFVVVKARAPSGGVVTRTKEGVGLVGAALKTGKPIHVKNAEGDERWSREAYTQAGHTAPKEIVIAPMRHGGRFLGAIELADHTDGAPPTDLSCVSIDCRSGSDRSPTCIRASTKNRNPSSVGRRPAEVCGA